MPNAADETPLDNTPAFVGFLEEMGRIASLMAYTSSLHAALLGEDVKRLVAKCLGDEDLEWLEPAARTSFVTERMLCALADALVWYVVTLLRTVFTVYPHQMLARSKSTDVEGLRVGAPEPAVPLKSVLDFETREQLLTSVIEDRVERLSYRSLKSLDTYFREALKLPLTEDSRLLQVASQAVATRNVIVHNRGLVNRRFRSLSEDDPPPLGQRLIISQDFLMAAYKAIGDLVEELDARAAQKYLQHLDSEADQRLLRLTEDLYGDGGWLPSADA